MHHVPDVIRKESAGYDQGRASVSAAQAIKRWDQQLKKNFTPASIGQEPEATLASSDPGLWL